MEKRVRTQRKDINVKDLSRGTIATWGLSKKGQRGADNLSGGMDPCSGHPANKATPEHKILELALLSDAPRN